MRGSRKFCDVFHRGLYGPPPEAIGPVFLRKPIATCGFPARGPPMDPHMNLIEIK